MGFSRQDDTAKIRRSFPAVLHPASQLKFLLPCSRQLAQCPCCRLGILFLNGQKHVGNRQFFRRQLIRLQPDAHGVVFRILFHTAHTRGPLYPVQEIRLGIVLQKILS